MTNSKKELREAGRNGLRFANAADGTYTDAKDAIKGTQYTCPVCKCKMHLTHTKSKNPIFARNPGAVHTMPECETLEKEKVKRSFEGLDPQTFIESLCRITRKKENPDPKKPKPPIPPENNEIPPEPTTIDIDIDVDIDSDPDFKSFSGLRQIAQAGLYDLDENAHQGDHKIADFLLNYKNTKEFFDNPNYVLGARIVLARYFGFDHKSKSLIFFIFKEEKIAVFKLMFTKPKEYDDFRKKFVEFVEIDGKTKLQRKHQKQDVLLACDEWYKIDRCMNTKCPGCNMDKCENCIGLYQAIFKNSKQLYLIPA